MGGGRWDADTYRSVTRSKIDSGTSFAYTNTTSAAPRSSWKAAPAVAPVQAAGAASPFAGQNVRESRDNDEHPNSTPIAVFFDETGSMGHIPRELQVKLAEFFGLLLRKGYCDDPQILMGAYGDAHVDRVPFQGGQFESDNRIDDALDELFLEGGGGGNGGETSTFVPYFLAQHTATDQWDKRGQKGYAFIIGDECALPITKGQIKAVLGDDVEADVSPEEAFGMAKERWDLYVLVINNGAAVYQNSVAKYGALVGEDHVIVLEAWQAVTETMAGLIGLAEGSIDLDDLDKDLADAGADAQSRAAAGKALSRFGGGGRVAKSDAPDDLVPTSGGGVSRL